MSKIVILGANFIGSRIAEDLSKDRQEIVIAEDLDDYYSPQLKKQNMEIILKNGEQTRDFTYIDDNVKINKRLLDNNAAKVKTLNSGSGNRISVNDLLNIFKNVTNTDSTVIYCNKQVDNAKHTLANVS